MSVQPPADWIVGLTPVDHPDNINIRYFTLSDLYRESADPLPRWETPPLISKPKPGIVPGGVILGRKSSTAPHTNRKGEYDSPIISRNHAQLLITPAGKLYIVDLGSLHGLSIQSDDSHISISNKRTAYQLCTGDKIVLGKEVSSRGRDYQPYILSVKFRHPALSELGILSRGRILNLTPEVAREVFASDADDCNFQRLFQAEAIKAAKRLPQTKLDDEDEEDVTFLKQRHFTPPGLSQTTALSVYDSDAASVVSHHDSISDDDSQVHSPRTNTYRVPSSLLYASEDDHEWPRGSSEEQQMDDDDDESFTDVEDDDGPEIMSSKSQGQEREAAISPPYAVDAPSPQTVYTPFSYAYSEVASNASDDELEPKTRSSPSGLGVWYSYTDELAMPRPSRPIQFASMGFPVAPVDDEDAPSPPAASPHYSPVSPDANAQAKSKGSPIPAIRSAARDVQNLYDYQDMSEYPLSTFVYGVAPSPLQPAERPGNSNRHGSIVDPDVEIEHPASDAEDMNSEADHSVQEERDEDDEHQDELCSQHDHNSDTDIGFQHVYEEDEEDPVHSDNEDDSINGRVAESDEEDDADEDEEEGYGQSEDSEEEDSDDDDDEDEEDMDEEQSDDEQENECDGEDDENDLSSDDELFIPKTVIPIVKTGVAALLSTEDDENETRNYPLGHVIRPLEAAVTAEIKRSEADQQAASEHERKKLLQEVQAMFERPVPAPRRSEIGVQTSIDVEAPATDGTEQAEQIAESKQEPDLIPCNNGIIAAMIPSAIEQPDSLALANNDAMSDASSEGPITPKNNKRYLPDDFVLVEPTASPSSTMISAYGAGAGLEVGQRPIKRMRKVTDDIKMIAIGAVLGSALTVTGLLKYASAS